MDEHISIKYTNNNSISTLSTPPVDVNEHLNQTKSSYGSADSGCDADVEINVHEEVTVNSEPILSTTTSLSTSITNSQANFQTEICPIVQKTIRSFDACSLFQNSETNTSKPIDRKNESTKEVFLFNQSSERPFSERSGSLMNPLNSFDILEPFIKDNPQKENNLKPNAKSLFYYSTYSKKIKDSKFCQQLKSPCMKKTNVPITKRSSKTSSAKLHCQKLVNPVTDSDRKQVSGATEDHAPSASYKYLSWREKDRRRRFREEWKHLWLVVPYGSYEVMCLVCHKIMTQRKLDTIKRHTIRRHAELLAMSETERQRLYYELISQRLRRLGDQRGQDFAIEDDLKSALQINQYCAPSSGIKATSNLPRLNKTLRQTCNSCVRGSIATPRINSKRQRVIYDAAPSFSFNNSFHSTPNCNEELKKMQLNDSIAPIGNNQSTITTDEIFAFIKHNHKWYNETQHYLLLNDQPTFNQLPYPSDQIGKDFKSNSTCMNVYNKKLCRTFSSENLEESYTQACLNLAKLNRSESVERHKSKNFLLDQAMRLQPSEHDTQESQMCTTEKVVGNYGDLRLGQQTERETVRCTNQKNAIECGIRNGAIDLDQFPYLHKNAIEDLTDGEVSMIEQMAANAKKSSKSLSTLNLAIIAKYLIKIRNSSNVQGDSKKLSCEDTNTMLLNMQTVCNRWLCGPEYPHTYLQDGSSQLNCTNRMAPPIPKLCANKSRQNSHSINGETVATSQTCPQINLSIKKPEIEQFNSLNYNILKSIVKNSNNNNLSASESFIKVNKRPSFDFRARIQEGHAFYPVKQKLTNAIDSTFSMENAIKTSEDLIPFISENNFKHSMTKECQNSYQEQGLFEGTRSSLIQRNDTIANANQFTGQNEIQTNAKSLTQFLPIFNNSKTKPSSESLSLMNTNISHKMNKNHPSPSFIKSTNNVYGNSLTERLNQLVNAWDIAAVGSLGSHVHK